MLAHRYDHLLKVVKFSLLLIVKAALISFIYTSNSFSQNTYVDTLNCWGGTPTYFVDLSATPDSVWMSTPSSRAGSCCNPPDNNCVQFELELSPNAQGIIFDIPDAICGAAPSGALYYQVDCGPLTSVGTVLCLDGTGPFVITFCKPGNNANCYSITSIPDPAGGGDVVTADGCIDTLAVSGLVESTITWTSISPGATGDYDNYLDCSIGCDTVVVTPQPGYPSSISYQTCGTIDSQCSSLTWCDTMTVSIVPTLFVDIAPQNPTICFGSAGTTITANPSGGAAPYTYLWSTGQTTQSIFVSSPGTYYVDVIDSTNCPSASDTIVVTQFANTIIADAGADITVCQSPVPTVNLNGSVIGTTTGIWSNGTGTFSPSDTDLNAQYTPSAAELSAGYVELILNTTNNGTCPGNSDTMTIFLPSFASNISSTPTNSSCLAADDASIDLTVNGGAQPVTYQWSSGQTTEDITGLNPGSYQVVVTDAIGCYDSLTTVVNEPPLLVVTDTVYSVYPSGHNISCFGASDGSIDITVSGGTPNYTYSWSNGSTAEDVSGLSVGSYTVIITDANGCQISQSYTLTEPPALTENITAATYPSGDNISCFGSSDGSVDLTIGGGSPGYTYLWDNGSTIEDISGLTAGTYNVTATDINGCTINSTITLFEPVELTESVTSPTFPSGDNVSCIGASDGFIDLTISGGSLGYSYAWDNGATTEDIWGLTAGTYNVTATDMNGCTITSSITLTEPPALTESVTAATYPSGDNISCIGLSDGSVDLTIGGGSPGYTYLWDTGATTEDISGLPAGTYNVTATDANGCTITSSITLVEPTNLAITLTPSVYAGGYNVSGCNADGWIDATVTGGSPGYTYSWDNGEVTEDISNLTPGTYNVTATDINGCTISDVITLTVPNQLTESITAATYPSGDNISCFGLSDGSIDLTIGGGAPAYTYLWNNGATSEDLTGVSAGTYSVTVTDDNGCQITSSITLTEPTPLSQSATVGIYPSGDNISCFGLSDGSIDMTFAGGSPGYTYLWDNGATTEDLTGLPAGTYNVTVTDINGCSIDTTISLVEPADLSISLTPSVYAGGFNVSGCNSDGTIDAEVLGGSPGYTYAWDNGDIIEDISNLPAGTYNISVTDINGCIINAGITLIAPNQLNESITAATYPSGDNISCYGMSDGSVDLTIGGGTPPYSYLWNNGATTEDLSGVPAGTYDVTITDDNGCQITSTITLTEPAPLSQSAILGIYPSGDNISCFGLSDGSIDMTFGGGSPGFSYSWNNGATTEDISGVAAGTYSVIVTDVNGCTIDTTITLVEPTDLSLSLSPSIYAGGYNTTGCNSDGTIDAEVLGGSPGYVYSWDNGQVIEDISSLAPGTYNLLVTDINGCTINAGITLVSPPGLTENITAATYPSGDNISCFGLSDGSIDLTIGGGTTGYAYSWSNGAVSEDLSNVAAGTYDVTVTDANGCEITSTITLTEPVPLSQSTTLSSYPSGDNISCFGLSDGSIDMTFNGGSPGYTYSWGNGATTEDLSGIPAGTYTVILTDVNGCTIDTTITLVEPTVLSTSLTPSIYAGGYNTTGCNLDGTIDLEVLGGSPGYVYAWNNGEITEDLSNLGPGSYDVFVTDINGCTIVDNITLIAPPGLTESITAATYPSGDNISCHNMSDGSIDLTIGGGSPNYSYDWDNGALTEDLTNVPAGTYNVTVTDANGCQISSSITLTEPTELTESVTSATYPSGDNISCTGMSDGSIDLTIGGGSPVYSFVWNNGAATEDLNGIPAGTYDVTVTDINGCIINSSITLVEPSPLSLTMDPSVYAGGYNATGCNLDGSIDVTVTGGSPNYDYSWNTGSTAQDISGLGEGYFWVTVTDINGCTITDTIFIDASDAILSSSVSSSFAGGWEISCNGAADGSIDLTVTGGASPLTYEWSNGSTNEDLTGLTAGQYEVIITDANGCDDTLNFELHEPPPLQDTISALQYFGGWNISCHGESDGEIYLDVNGGTPAYAFNWSNGSTTEDLSGLPAGTYTVTYVDQNGCANDIQITLTEPPLLTGVIDVLTDYYGLPVSCEGEYDGQLALNVAGGTPEYDISWNTSPVQSGVMATNLGEGTYMVTVTDSNGCTVTDQVTLEANPLPLIVAPDPAKICYGDEVIIDSGTEAGNSCQWTFSNGQTLDDCGPKSVFFDYIGCLDAELVVVSPEQCTSEVSMDEYICIDPLPQAVFYANETKITTVPSDVYFYNNSTGAISYEWDFGDGTTEYGFNAHHFFPDDQEGIYNVTLFAFTEYGCVDTANLEITVVEEFIMYVPNVFTPDGDDNNNIFQPIISSGFDPYSYTLLIFDRWGEIVFESHNTDVGWDGTYSDQGLCQDGVYVWTIVISDKETGLPEKYIGHVTLLK